MHAPAASILRTLLLCSLAAPLSAPAQSAPAPPQRPDARPAPPQRPAPGGGPQIQPSRPSGPQIQPPRPSPGNGRPQIQPPRPNPGNGGPQIQPPRPGGPQIQPPRPSPGNGGPQIQPPRPGNGNRPSRPHRPPQWGRPPQNRPTYNFRPRDRDYLRRHYLRHLAYINRARRPVFTIGGFFPYADIGYLTPLPPSLYGYLPPPPPGYQMGYFDGYVVVYDPVTYFIANVVDLLQ